MFQKYASQILRKHAEVDLDSLLVVAAVHNTKEPAAVFGKPVQEKQPSRISGTNSLLRWVKPGAAYVMNHQVICSLFCSRGLKAEGRRGVRSP
jgi:hypothetical protein